MRGERRQSEKGSDALCVCVLCFFLSLSLPSLFHSPLERECVLASKSVSARRQEIARVARVGSTPAGARREQREHLPPHQERLFHPPRRGDAGMRGVGAAKGREVAGAAPLVCFSLSPAHLCSLFAHHHPFLPYTQWVQRGCCCSSSSSSLLALPCFSSPRIQSLESAKSPASGRAAVEDAQSHVFPPFFTFFCVCAQARPSVLLELSFNLLISTPHWRANDSPGKSSVH